MNAKPWQIAVIVVGLIVGVTSLIWSMSGGEDLVDRYRYYVDVESGQLYRLDTDKMSGSVPARHPETGRFTLLPTYKEANGSWRVTERDRAALANIEKGARNKAINLDDGSLTLPSDGVKEYTRYTGGSTATPATGGKP